jgi:diguanylate cyclase (GGDEF)-like protein
MRPTLLLVDSNPADLLDLQVLLRDEYELRTLPDGVDAAQFALDNRADLVLLDLSLPNFQASTVFAQLRSHELASRLPVIFVTPSDDPAEVAQCFARGGVDQLSKPYHPALVQARIRHHVQAAHTRSALNRLIQEGASSTAANERSFHNSLGREWRRCARASTYLSLLIIEVDDFQDYLTARGEVAGASCLQEVAARIAVSIHREPDLLARYDATRFACLLPDTSPVGAISVAQRLQHAMKDLSQRLTISQGIATLIPDPHASPGGLLVQAEELLALAKHQGGDRICDEATLRSVGHIV